MMLNNNQQVLHCFKAYDIRGRVDSELSVDIAYRIGRAYAQFLKPTLVVVGSDVRESSEPLKHSLARGLQDSGVNVIDIGLVGTEEIYFATPHLNADGGICITASHNPIEYNGMKLVKRNAEPISGDTGLDVIKSLAERNDFTLHDRKGTYLRRDIYDSYVNHMLGYIDLNVIKPFKIVVNSGNGVAGHVIDRMENIFNEMNIPIEFVKLHHEPDGSFPNGIPNPLLPENRKPTIDMIKQSKADLAIAWDGDFDRCFFFDENGNFIDGYYIVGLLAEIFLEKHHGGKVIHDPRVLWNTQDLVRNAGGTPILSKTGHAFIKERMCKENAIYGGEMSGHHYFRDFWYCDSGMLPWLFVLEFLSSKGASISEIVKDRILRYPTSGEINRKLSDPKGAMRRIEMKYHAESLAVDKTDGLSMEFDEWRFNVRSSNTEAVVRLNVESKGNRVLMTEKTNEILSALEME